MESTISKGGCSWLSSVVVSTSFSASFSMVSVSVLVGSGAVVSSSVTTEESSGASFLSTCSWFSETLAFCADDTIVFSPIIGLSICLVSAQINTILVNYLNMDDLNYSITVSPINEEILKSIPLMIFALVFAKKGDQIKEGTREDLKQFHEIMITTGKRDGFIIRPLEYFEKMYDELGQEHMKILMAYYEGKPISGVIPIIYGNKTWYLYGASSNEHRNLMPNYLLQWEMIKLAIKNKSDIYDLRGVPGIADDSNGLYRFKKGFGAEYTEFVGEVYIPFKPIMYNMYKFSEKAFRELRALKLKFKK